MSCPKSRWRLATLPKFISIGRMIFACSSLFRAPEGNRYRFHPTRHAGGLVRDTRSSQPLNRANQGLICDGVQELIRSAMMTRTQIVYQRLGVAAQHLLG